ncbi:MAG: sigma-54 interaction domain-containing protein [Bacillota bacterium]|jgi:transcriptional regulator with PAS, ATPase and Fis domain
MRLEINSICDYFEQGIIIIDSNGIIQLYNLAAQEFFGLLPSPGPGHPAGSLEPGDIVILAVNRLGRDDGNLNPQLLDRIGLAKAPVHPDEGLLAVGQVGPGAKIRPMWKTFTDVTEQMTLEYVLPSGIHIKAGHYRPDRLLWIEAGERFDYYYHIAVGHAVVIRPDGQLKFYQVAGYTARGEAIGDILGGASWAAKGNQPPPQVLGRHISTIHPENLGIERLMIVAQGLEDGFSKQDYEINGIPTRCSIHPIDENGERKGALLQITDISEVRMAEEERDAARATLLQYDDSRYHPAFAKIVGSSKEISIARDLALKAARSNSTVLLLGESGTGKGLFADAIHNAGPRANKPFVYVNCAAIPDNLLESELFGYVEGAFTGARPGGKAGSFEQAQGGTLFLDEIAELDIPLQAKLLHALQTRQIQRLGDTKPLELDVRIIAATNQKLEQLVIEGRFREDLYYRLNVICLVLPSLRQRAGDIPELVRYLLPKICERAEKALMVPVPELIQVLSQYHWPGNIRELENVLERAVNFAEGKALTPAHLPEHLQGPKSDMDSLIVNKVIPHHQAIELTELKLLQLALKQTDNNRSQAMALLEMGRTNFYRKLNKYRLLD